MLLGGSGDSSTDVRHDLKPRRDDKSSKCRGRTYTYDDRMVFGLDRCKLVINRSGLVKREVVMMVVW